MRSYYFIAQAFQLRHDLSLAIKEVRLSVCLSAPDQQRIASWRFKFIFSDVWHVGNWHQHFIGLQF